MTNNLLSPMNAIRQECLGCCGDQALEVRECPATECPIHAYRFGKNPAKRPAQYRTSLRAIRGKCVDCSGFFEPAVNDCQLTDCALWPYRKGHNPSRSGLGDSGNLRGSDSLNSKPCTIADSELALSE